MAQTHPYIGLRHDDKLEVFMASDGPKDELLGTLYKRVEGPYRNTTAARKVIAAGVNIVCRSCGRTGNTANPYPMIEPPADGCVNHMDFVVGSQKSEE